MGYKHVLESGLKAMYENVVNFRPNIRMIGAIAFLPLLSIEAASDLLAQQCGADEQPVLDYFESMYVGDLRRGVRRAPLFAHHLWNVNERVQHNLPRTTNVVEGWHNAFTNSVAQSHANIWIFVDCIKREHTTVRMKVIQDDAGVPPPPSKRRYAELNTRITFIVNDFHNRTIFGFLRAISYNLSKILTGLFILFFLLVL